MSYPVLVVEQTSCKGIRKKVSRDVLAIEYSEGIELTLESLDPIKDYPKPEPVEQTVDIQVKDIDGQVIKVKLLLDQGQVSHPLSYVIL